MRAQVAVTVPHGEEEESRVLMAMRCSTGQMPEERA